MRRWGKVSLAGAVLAAAACSESPSAPAGSHAIQSELVQQGPGYSAASPAFSDLFASPGEHVHVMPPNVPAWLSEVSRAGKGGGGGGGGGSGTGIYYHGGPVIYNTNIAAIYWSASTLYAGGPAPGTAGSGANDGSLLGLFMRSDGGSPYFNINTTYYDGTGTHVSNSLTYTQYWADANAPAAGASVSDAAVQAEVVAGFTSGNLSYDPSTLYAVFSAPGVNLGGGAGTSYCAYHGHFSWNGNDVKYAVMPYDAYYGSACAISGASPTSDPAAAAEANTLAHETEETTTDEDLNAWYDRRGYENADKCAWKFGTSTSTATGTANQTMGGVDWLIQMNWVNAGSGGCVQHWP